ncbi:hypothetical protein L6R53_06900 [Myxococcota bacterium]|nr:hypothetical protein [Myxococcota bacterium]
MPPSADRRASSALAWTLGLVAAGVPAALHVDWILRDARLPRDLGLFYQRVPQVWAWLVGEGGEADATLRPLLSHSGGWYEALLAGWLALVGRSPATFQVVDLAWMLALFALVAVAAAAVSDVGGHTRDAGAGARAARAALLALLLAAGSPFLAIFPRLSWIHVPEAVLILGAALPWLRDPTLPRGAGWSGLLGALAVLLRPSALPWLAPLGLAMAAGVDGRRPPPRTLAVVAGAWLLGAAPALVSLGRYLGPKVEARERYARDVPPLLEQVLLGAGPLVPVAALVGGAFFLARGRRAPGRLLLSWVALTLALWAAFRAGMDNFLVGFAALAILGGAGLAHLPRLGPALALAPWLLLHLPRLLPPPAEPSALSPLLGALSLPPQASLHSPYRPYTAWGRQELAQLLAASCPDQGRCTLGVDQGLLVPYSEEPGRLELFLAGHDRVDLLDLRGDAPLEGLPRVHALVHYACGERDASWRLRYPRSLTLIARLVRSQELRPAWTRTLSRDCRVLWLVPDGQWVQPAAVPADGDDLRFVALPDLARPPPGLPAAPPPGPPDALGLPRGRDGQVLPRGAHRPPAPPPPTPTP